MAYEELPATREEMLEIVDRVLDKKSRSYVSDGELACRWIKEGRDLGVDAKRDFPRLQASLEEMIQRCSQIEEEKRKLVALIEQLAAKVGSEDVVRASFVEETLEAARSMR
jgi:hypothetical protein